MFSLPILVLAVVLAGCSAIPDLYPGNTVGSESEIQGLNEETENYRSSNLKIPLRLGGSVSVSIKYFESKLPGKKKFVVILPVYGSTEYPSFVMAQRLTKWNESADFNVALIRERGDLFDWEALAKADSEDELYSLLGDGVERIKQSVVEVQSVIDWARERPEADDRRIGIIGFSLGSMVATIAAGIDTRIKAGAFVMAGGDPHGIFARSEIDFIKAVRLNALKKFARDDNDFKRIVVRALDSVDPNHFASVIPPETVIIFQAGRDTFLPESSRESFWKAFHRNGITPLRVVFPRDHKMAFLSMTPFGGNYTDIKIAEFLRQRL